MDKDSHLIEASLRTNKRRQEEEEEKVFQLRQKLQGQQWLEEDLKHIHKQEMQLLDLLRQGWQGAEARGFHNYLEEQQQVDSSNWKKGMRQQEEEIEDSIQKSKMQLLDFQIEQQELQTRWLK
ncbi:ribonuclease P [Listeria grandensis]|uniref:Ribonuclease P n=1 Tax=Listeria grandensis TaxID=1494963 RepID=A0A7X0Y2Q7_9LIST|nr:ribonuclease P [Listeria grandensis]MBC1935327.1 ribonuclease P [Listeria grandensis]